MVATVPAIVLAGLICLQLLAAGYSLTLADGAAEAGAIAVASGLPARAGGAGGSAGLGSTSESRSRSTAAG